LFDYSPEVFLRQASAEFFHEFFDLVESHLGFAFVGSFVEASDSSNDLFYLHRSGFYSGGGKLSFDYLSFGLFADVELGFSSNDFWGERFVCEGIDKHGLDVFGFFVCEGVFADYWFVELYG
jgi:hypothetical protein